MISQKTVQEVMNTARVEDVIGDFMNLRRRGVNLIGNCPFHDEKTPSFTVSPAKNIYKCFGCGKGGDSVGFIMEHETLSFPESIKYLAQKYKIEIEETVSSAQDIEQKEVTDSLYIVNEFARDYFSDVLMNRQEGRNIGLSYFKERGFRESTIKQFELGYATDDKSELTAKAVDKKFNIEHLRAVGLTSKFDQDFFRSRVMFTIHNVSGKVVAFAGRTLSSDKKIPKYINSPESEIYNKRAVLYGLYFAKEHIRKQDECILVEGYTDVISLHQGQVQNTVASSGTSLTKEQIRLIKRYTQNIKIIYDGDAAGIKAALRGLDLVLESDMNVKLVLLPEGHDPDSFLSTKGSDQFAVFLKENEEDFVFFKTKLLLKESGNDPIKKTAVIRDVVSSIAKIPDTFKRTLYVRQCSSMLDLSESILINEVNKVIKDDLKKQKFQNDRERGEKPKDEEPWLNTQPTLSTSQPSIIKNDAYQERAVCSILINYSEELYDEENKTTIANFIIENCQSLLDVFDIELYRLIIEDAVETIKNQGLLNHAYYSSHSKSEIRDIAIEMMTSPYIYAEWEKKEIKLQTQKMPDENYVKDVENAILRLQLRKSKKVINDLQAHLNHADETIKLSDDYIIDIKVMQELIKQRNEIAAKLGTVTFGS